ncbi:hypothetical protein LP414_20210 [Polaromonas sp. P1(28)-13]|nr:hypothetical protein LP414_20210 [Polaromonas sp. P1(28)-13]
MAGDGRVNENIALTTVHHVFHAEHNRLVDHTKDVILATAGTGDVSFLNQWLTTAVTAVPADLSTLEWNGERLFQAAKFATEMQYQHLVFEEFAHKIQPQVDIFFAPTQVYDTGINPAIVAEFAHTVYRFGHSMLLETVDRLDPNFASSEIGLIEAFLNPLAFDLNNTLTAEQAAGAIVRGLTRQVANEIDEFKTEALRNNLLGLPLDLATINLARGRDTGIPSLNAARREFYQMTGDSQLTPYTSWVDFVQNMKHAESLVNFIAAYGTHATILAATTLADKRAAAMDIVFLTGTSPADRLDFLNSTGPTWSSDPVTGVTNTGLDDIDFWVGGLAEEQMPFGGFLGSTFNFVFETQMEKLQDGDRFYYLERVNGLNFLTELENNSFAKLIMANTNATHLPGDVFSTPGFILEVDPTKQFTGLNDPGPDGIQGTLDDVVGADGIAGNSDPVGGSLLVPLVSRGPGFLQYTGDQHVVLGGTAGNDTIISSEGDDTLYGDDGNDRLEGGYGNDMILGGAGDDILTDLGGDDNMQGGDGNDVIQGGNGINLILGGFGNDFIVTGEDASEVFGGPGNDFILGVRANEAQFGNEGDDWLELGAPDGSVGDNFDTFVLDPVRGNDVFIGEGITDRMDGEGGDDIMVGNPGGGEGDRYEGMSGFDWAVFKDDPAGVIVDLGIRAFNEVRVTPSSASVLARFESVEGLSGSAFGDILQGDDANAAAIAVSGINGSVMTNIGLISGMQGFLNDMLGTPTTPVVTSFGSGNIILGGDGSDIITGRGGDDLIDGDKWLNVRISVRNALDHTSEIGSANSMTELIPAMLAGTINPSQLEIVREIMPGTGGFDTADFNDVRANYSVIDNLDGTFAVTHTGGRLTDGTDTLRNIERLQFADQSQVLVPGLNNEPVGALTLNDSTPAVGQVLTVSAANVADADNTASGGAITGPLTFFWQFERDPGSGVFENILVFGGGESSRVTGPTFTVTPDLEGFALRVRAVYQDAHGVLETVFSAPTAPTTPLGTGTVNIPGTAAISDTTPTEGSALSATVTDPDGIGAVTHQWQAGGPGVLFTDIAGATSASFTPTQAQVGLNLRVVASYTDALGNLELVTSAATGGVGDLMIGTPAPDTLSGTPFDDNIQGLGGNDMLNGLAGNDLLDGGADDDVLVGGLGNDTMVGGLGNDTYEVNEAGDVVVENADAGIDTVWAYVSHTLSANVENLVLSNAVGNFTGTGNDLDNLMIGSKGNDVLVGGLGNDTVVGGLGNDTMVGGLGNDTYEVNEAGDVVVEDADAGIDTVWAYVSHTLSANVENLVLSNAVGNFTGTGNALDNLMIGSKGNDVLVGGLGNDTMVGGLGNDTYEVNEAGDVVVENADAGIDTVWAYVSHTLSANVENLVLSNAVGNFTGTGNDLDNLMIGSKGNDVLVGGLGNDTVVGGLGNDTMVGGLGNDTYEVNEAGDVVVEDADAGIDTVWAYVSHTLSANVENLVLSNAVGNFTGTGNALDNLMIGSKGNDVLVGGAGADTLTGGIGADTFALTALGDSGVGAGLRDIITDFLSGTDRIDFTGIDANTGVAGDQAFTMLGTGAFFGVAGQLRYDVVGADTVMQGDVNGDGAADFELQLTGIHSFVPADLLL